MRRRGRSPRASSLRRRPQDAGGAAEAHASARRATSRRFSASSASSRSRSSSSSCSSSGSRAARPMPSANETAHYLAEIGAIGNASARLGQQLSTLLTTPGLNQEDLDAKLGGYVQTADNQVARAEELEPAGSDGRTRTRAPSSRCATARMAFAASKSRSRRRSTRRMRASLAESCWPRRSACSRATSSGPIPSSSRRRPCSRTRESKASTSRRPSSSPRMTSSARARSPLSGSGSRVRRRAVRRRVCTATRSHTSRRFRAASFSRPRPRRRSR